MHRCVKSILSRSTKEKNVTFRALVSNLVYAYPRGYVRTLKGYARFNEVLCRFEQYLLIKSSHGVSKFLFLCFGVREHIKVGNRYFRAAFSNHVAIRHLWRQAFKMWRQEAFPSAVCIKKAL